jgi:hypothetical protein
VPELADGPTLEVGEARPRVGSTPITAIYESYYLILDTNIIMIYIRNHG